MSEQTSFSIYACSLRKQWLSTIQRDCYGCEFDRPSQLDHDKCCMLEPEEQLESYYYQARLAVDEDAILAIIMMETGETRMRSEQLRWKITTRPCDNTCWMDPMIDVYYMCISLCIIVYG